MQVKASSVISKHGSYTFDMRSTGGTKGKVYKTQEETICDSYFFLCSNGDMFYIPKESLSNKDTINVKGSKSIKNKGKDNPWIKYLVKL